MRQTHVHLAQVHDADKIERSGKDCYKIATHLTSLTVSENEVSCSILQNFKFLADVLVGTYSRVPQASLERF